MSKIKWTSIITNIVILIVGIIMAIPFIWMISVGFSKSANLALPYPPSLIPQDPSTFNYSIIVRHSHLARLYFNTMIVSFTNVIFVIFVSSLSAFAFAKGSFKGRNILFFIVLSTMMIPQESILIPIYLLMRKLRLFDTLWCLILPQTFNAFSVFLIFQYMRTIPDELVDAAKIDGCFLLSIYWWIAMPLSKPILVTVAFLNFLWRWNDFLYPLVLINSVGKYTLSLGMTSFQGKNANYPGLIMALITLATMPALIIYIFLQKYIIKAFATSGLTG